jgi:hypothetical protein
MRVSASKVGDRKLHRQHVQAYRPASQEPMLHLRVQNPAAYVARHDPEKLMKFVAVVHCGDRR